MMNLVEYLHANRHEMSETDAAFVTEAYRADIVALSREEKELMSRFLERHFSWIFPSQVYYYCSLTSHLLPDLSALVELTLLIRSVPISRAESIRLHRRRHHVPLL